MAGKREANELLRAYERSAVREEKDAAEWTP